MRTNSRTRWAILNGRTNKIMVRAIPSRAVAIAVCAPGNRVIIDPRSIQR